MKIAMTAEVLEKEHYSGIEQYVYNLAHQLLELNFVDLTLIASRNFPQSLFPDHTSVIHHAPRLIFGSGLLSAALFPPKGLAEFDLVHCPTVTAPFFFRPGSKVIMTVHDLTPILFPRLHTRRSTLYYRYLLKQRLRFVDRFIAVSRRTKEDLVDLFGLPSDKIDVVYSGVSSQYKPSTQIRDNFLLAVATLEPRKNLKRLIQAYVDLRKEREIQDRLILVGKKGWSYDDILTVPTEYKDDIVFTGYLPEKDLIRLYQTARLFVYPSLYEGFGLPVLEAMACGCPVITSCTSSMPEVAGEAALYIDPSNTVSLKHAICTLVHDDEQRAKLAIEGPQRALQFSWQRCADQTLEVYQKGLKG